MLHNAASTTTPVSKYKPEGTPKVKHCPPRPRTSKTQNVMWISEGRPRGMCHESYKNYKRAKMDFRNGLQSAHDEFMTKAFMDIDEASECDVRLF